MSLFIILLRHNCHLLTSNGFELLCNVCYWKFLLIAFVVSLHHQALISCGARCYFLKLGYQLFFEKIKNHEFSIFFSFSVPKMSHFLEWLLYDNSTYIGNLCVQTKLMIKIKQNFLPFPL